MLSPDLHIFTGFVTENSCVITSLIIIVIMATSCFPWAIFQFILTNVLMSCFPYIFNLHQYKYFIMPVGIMQKFVSFEMLFCLCFMFIAYFLFILTFYNFLSLWTIIRDSFYWFDFVILFLECDFHLLVPIVWHYNFNFFSCHRRALVIPQTWLAIGLEKDIQSLVIFFVTSSRLRILKCTAGL